MEVFHNTLARMFAWSHLELYIIVAFKPDLSSKKAFLADKSRIKREGAAEKFPFLDGDPYMLSSLIDVVDDDHLHSLWITVQWELTQLVLTDLRLDRYTERVGFKFTFASTYKHMIISLRSLQI